MVRAQMNQRSSVMRQWKRLLERAVLSKVKVHNYFEYRPLAPKFTPRSLPASAVQPSNTSSISVEGLGGATFSASLYSRGASGLHLEHVDLELCRISSDDDKLLMADKIWHDCLLDIDGLLARKDHRDRWAVLLLDGQLRGFRCHCLACGPPCGR